VKEGSEDDDYSFAIQCKGTLDLEWTMSHRRCHPPLFVAQVGSGGRPRAGLRGAGVLGKMWHGNDVGDSGAGNCRIDGRVELDMA